MSWRSKNTELSLVFLVLAVYIYKITSYSTTIGAFSFDPDFAYLAQAFFLTQKGYATFFDHPGTPWIMALGFFHLPIKILASSSGVDLGTWIAENFIPYATFFRYFALSVVTTGVMIYSYVVYNHVKKPGAAFFVLLGLSCFYPAYYASLTISPDAFTYLLFPMWAAALLKWDRSQNIKYFYWAAVFAGLLVANKITNAAAVFTIFFLALTTVNLKPLRAIVAIAVGFFAGTIVSWRSLPGFVSWIKRLIGHKNIYGTGDKGYTDAITLHYHLIRTWQLIPVLWILLGILFLAGLYYFVKNRKSIYQIKFNPPIWLALFLSATICFILFSKYPLHHYQTGNYMILLLGVVLLLKNAPKLSYLTFATWFLFFAPSPNESFYSDLEKRNRWIATIEADRSKNKAMTELWGNHIGFQNSFFWMNNWSNGTFDPYYWKTNWKIYFLDQGNFANYQKAGGELLPLSTICFDTAYIFKVHVDQFIQLNQNFKLTVRPIGIPLLTAVENLSCKNK